MTSFLFGTWFLQIISIAWRHWKTTFRFICLLLFFFNLFILFNKSDKASLYCSSSSLEKYSNCMHRQPKSLKLSNTFSKPLMILLSSFFSILHFFIIHLFIILFWLWLLYRIQKLQIRIFFTLWGLRIKVGQGKKID